MTLWESVKKKAKEEEEKKKRQKRKRKKRGNLTERIEVASNINHRIEGGREGARTNVERE